MNFFERPANHFGNNKTVQAFIIADSLMWVVWNFITPIFAIFVVQEVSGSTVETAAFGYSIHLITRVVFELFSGQYLTGKRGITESQKIAVVVVGVCIVSVSYIGFIFTSTIPLLFLFYGLSGMGIGISAPPRLALFSEHLDRREDSLDWSIRDTSVFLSMAITGALGGFIASRWGFEVLFLVAATVNILSLIPHLYYSKRRNYFSI